MSACVKCGCRGTVSKQNYCARCLLQLGLDFADTGLNPWTVDDDAVVDESGDAIEATHPLRIGNYKIISEIARGGMGIVYKAQQTGLQRVVALKLILAGQLSSQESIERFRLEATTAANLHHPCIVPIYEIGQVDSQHFYSMEFVDGKSLADSRAEIWLDPEDRAGEARAKQTRIASCIAQVADAIEYAHQRGVLHRDIKPSNILIDGSSGHPRITDFGLAKLINDVGAGLTLSSTMLGSPSYLSPEQANGDFEEITIATDIYGIGATLYELLAGRPPFLGKNAVDVLRKAMHGHPRNVEEVNPKVDADLATICMKCLEKRPGDRYPTAAALAEDLRRFSRGQPILARQASSAELVLRWARSHPRQVATLLFIAFTILLGSSTAFWQWFRAETANAELNEKLNHLEWSTIDTLINEDQTSLALSRIAALLKKDPSNWQAAMFSLSVLEHHRFPIPSMAPLKHPNGSILTVAHLSPDAQHIVSASLDKTVRIWNRTDREKAELVLKHPDSVSWIDLSQDGKWIASGCADGSLRIWDYLGNERPLEPKLTGPIKKVLFHPNNSLVLAFCDMSWIIVDVETGKVVGEQAYNSGSLIRVKFVNDGQDVFVAHKDGTNSSVAYWSLAIRATRSQINPGWFDDADSSGNASRVVAIAGNSVSIWDVNTEKRERGFSCANSRFTHLSINQSGSRVAVAGLNQFVQAWDLDTATPLTPELSHDYLVNGVVFVDEERILSWSDDSSVKFWSSTTGRAVVEPCRHSNRVVHAEIVLVDGTEHILSTVSHNNFRTKESGIDTGAVCLWKLLSGNPCQNCGTIDTNGYDGGAISSDGEWIAMAKTDQTVSVLDRKSQELLMGPIRIKGGGWGVQFTPDRKLLVITTSQGQVLVWSCERNELHFPPVQLNTTIQPMEMSADGTFFVTGATDGKIRVFETYTGKIHWEQTHGGEINSVAISPDGNWVASGGENRIINVWHRETGQLKQTLIGHKNEVMRVRFTPDAKFVASASQDFSGRVWDLQTGETKWHFHHQGEVIDVDVSSDGKLVATASRDHTVAIWDLQTGSRYSRPLIHPYAVRNLQFFPDGTLLTVDFLGLRLWDVSSGLPVSVRIPQARIGGTGFQVSHTVSHHPGEQLLLSIYDSFQPIMCHIATPSKGQVPPWWPLFLESISGQLAAEGYTGNLTGPRVNYLEISKNITGSPTQGYYEQWISHWSEGRVFSRGNK